MESVSAPEIDDHKKKMLQGFDEISNFDEVICKRLRKEAKHFSVDDDFENITDLNAYTAMFPVHKVSKFGGGSLHKQKSSKMNVAKADQFDE